MAFPACVICFYMQEDGSLPPSRHVDTLEEAYALVSIHHEIIECVMLQGDVLHRKMYFPNFQAYLNRRNSFHNPLAQAIFDRIVGEYSPRENKMT